MAESDLRHGLEDPEGMREAAFPDILGSFS